MATLTELTNNIAAARDQLRAAIDGATDSWEDATLPPEADEVNPNSTGDAWTPKQAVTHAVGGVSFFSSFLATGLGIDFTISRPSIETPEDALDALDAAFEAVDALVAAASDDALTLPAPVGDGQIMYATTRGYEVQKDVTGALSMLALHTADHAEQIVRGTATT